MMLYSVVEMICSREVGLVDYSVRAIFEPEKSQARSGKPFEPGLNY